jgi:hypothetical protein
MAVRVSRKPRSSLWFRRSAHTFPSLSFFARFWSWKPPSPTHRFQPGPIAAFPATTASLVFNYKASGTFGLAASSSGVRMSSAYTRLVDASGQGGAGPRVFRLFEIPRHAIPCRSEGRHNGASTRAINRRRGAVHRDSRGPRTQQNLPQRQFSLALWAEDRLTQ